MMIEDNSYGMEGRNVVSRRGRNGGNETEREKDNQREKAKEGGRRSERGEQTKRMWRKEATRTKRMREGGWNRRGEPTNQEGEGRIVKQKPYCNERKCLHPTHRTMNSIELPSILNT